MVAKRSMIETVCQFECQRYMARQARARKSWDRVATGAIIPLGASAIIIASRAFAQVGTPK